jgi:hypothetical protein
MELMKVDIWQSRANHFDLREMGRETINDKNRSQAQSKAQTGQPLVKRKALQFGKGFRVA